jgi:hypothetical protein
MTSDVAAIKALVATIRPLLAGNPPEVQGTALADLLAIWVAGHIGDSDDETGRLRETILAIHSEMVRKLVPVNDAIIHGRRR